MEGQGERLVRAVIDGFPNGTVVLFDRELRYRLVGPAALPISGSPAGEKVGRTVEELYDAATVEVLAPRLRATLEGTPQSFDVEHEGTVQHAETRPVEIDGDPHGVLVTQDVTDERRKTEAFEVLNRLVRHDINNDVSIVLGWADLLADHVDEEGRAYVDRIRAAGERIVELTENSRDYMGTLAEGAAFDLEPTLLRPFVETELAVKREIFPAARFTVGELPDVSILANELLSTVLKNLLNNAVRHSDREHPAVDLTVAADEDRVTLCVADDGPGIPDERKEQVFGKGERGLESPGTGIGLYLVRTLVEAYGGTVRVADNDPRGAVFVVELERADATHTAEPAAG